MNTDAQRLGLGPEGVKRRIAQLATLDAPAEAGPAQAVPFDALLELLGGEVRMLQGHARERDEPIGLGRADLGQRLVLDPDELRRDVPVRRVPVGVDAERLDVDALRVHRAEALLGIGHEEGLGLELAPHERHRGRDRAVGVHVHRLHASPAHDHLAPPPLRGAGPTARDERRLGHG
jgi:hypothetical protein